MAPLPGISGPTESLSIPKDGEVAFFTNILKLRVRLSLQPFIQRILAHTGHAPGQYNLNFWVTLMGTAIEFGLARRGSRRTSNSPTSTTSPGQSVQAMEAGFKPTASRHPIGGIL